MEDKRVQTAKLILENETYEFNIEDGKTLHLELKNADNEIQIKRKQVNNSFSSGFARVQFDERKPIELSNDLHDEPEYESSILNVLNGVNTLDNDIEMLSNESIDKQQHDENTKKEYTPSKKLDEESSTPNVEVFEPIEDKDKDSIKSEEKVTVPEIEETIDEDSNKSKNYISNDKFNINFFGSEVDDYEDEEDEDLKF